MKVWRNLVWRTSAANSNRHFINTSLLKCEHLAILKMQKEILEITAEPALLQFEALCVLTRDNPVSNDIAKSINKYIWNWKHRMFLLESQFYTTWTIIFKKSTAKKMLYTNDKALYKLAVGLGTWLCVFLNSVLRNNQSIINLVMNNKNK